MSRSRKKKMTLPLLVAVLLIALTVLLLAMLLAVALSACNPAEETPTDPYTTPATTPGAEPAFTAQTSRNQSPNATSQTPSTTNAPSESITTKAITTLAPITTTAPITEPPVPEIEYQIDVSDYMNAIDPQGDLWDDAYLRLVNVANPIGKDEENTIDALKGRTSIANCQDYKYTWRAGIDLNETALKALSAMFQEAAACGIKNLDVTSGYRSYSYQDGVFNRNCNNTYHWVCDDDACNVDWIGKSATCPICGKKTSKTIPITRFEQEANVATYSCAPGTSDHQTGLAVDVVQTTLPSRFASLIQEFGETDAGKWLAENCYRFGFVLRFPEGKEDATGIIYEPWHFRYVGRTHALKMQELDLCLEEYVEYLNSIGYFE